MRWADGMEVDYTKFGPKCKICYEKIMPDQLRLKYFSYGNYPKSFHVECFVKRYLNACLEIGRCAEEIVLERNNGERKET